MKKILSILLIVCIITSGIVSVYADETGTDDVSNNSVDTTFDFTEEQQKINELGIPTLSSVAQLQKEADDLWEAEDYAKAADAYAEYAKSANWLANIISAGLEPYYGASYDDKKAFSPKTMSTAELGMYEMVSNSYKAERNRAMLYEGLCYFNLDKYELALPLLIKALDLIEIDDETNWVLALDALYTIIGLK